MPLFDPVRVEQFRRQTTIGCFTTFGDVALPPGYFVAPRNHRADLLFRPMDNGSGCLVLINQNVAYIGDDPGLTEAFARAPLHGWRPLTTLRPARAESVLQETEILGIGPAGSRCAAARAEPPW
jgi:hypothetical protein